MLIGVLAEPAAADDQATCFSGAAGNANIDACTRLIVSKKLTGGDLIRAYVARAVILARTGEDRDRVIADCSEVLRLDPKNVDALALRATSYQRQGDYGRALADANEAQRLGPKSILAHNALSVFYNRKGDYDRALAEANESLRLGPTGMYGLKNRGLSLENKGELDKALVSYRAALALDPQRQERAGREAAEGIERIEKKLAIRTPATTSVGTEQSSPTPSQELGLVPGRRVALVIGNDRYESLPLLQKAVNDARAVSDRLGRLGFEVVRVENANRRTMNEKLSQMAGRIGRGDTAFFFFAGHGVAIRDTNYLLPTDTPPAREGQEGLIAREAIGADAILDALQERGARVIVLVLDACRDNPFKTASNRTASSPNGTNAWRGHSLHLT